MKTSKEILDNFYAQDEGDFQKLLTEIVLFYNANADGVKLSNRQAIHEMYYAIVELLEHRGLRSDMLDGDANIGC